MRIKGEVRISIHPTAIIDRSAKVDSSAVVGPYCIIGPDVVISKNVNLVAHVCVSGITEIGEGTDIYPFASIGYRPQDLKYHGERSKVVIGKNNSIREYVTIHPGTETGRMETTVGDNNLFMAHVHVAHDCIVGNNIVFANAATLAGHVIVGDNSVLGGLSAVHQWVRIGKLSMIGGMSGVERDVVPYSTVEGNRATVRGLNVLGLKRKGANLAEISRLKDLFSAIFNKNNTLNENIRLIQNMPLQYETERDILDFLLADTNRSYCLPYEQESAC